MNRIAGYMTLQYNGNVVNAVGDFSYNLGKPKRETLVGPDRIHGYKETPQVPYIEGEIRDGDDIDLATICTLKDVTATLALANGKTIVLKDAIYCSDGKVGTGDANIEFRLEGSRAEEVAAE